MVTESAHEGCISNGSDKAVNSASGETSCKSLRAYSREHGGGKGQGIFGGSMVGL